MEYPFFSFHRLILIHISYLFIFFGLRYSIAQSVSSSVNQEKFKNKPWLLEDETGQHQYSGQLEGTQSATYYLLMMQGKEFVATPAGSWYLSILDNLFLSFFLTNSFLCIDHSKLKVFQGTF